MFLIAETNYFHITMLDTIFWYKDYWFMQSLEEAQVQ